MMVQQAGRRSGHSSVAASTASRQYQLKYPSLNEYSGLGLRGATLVRISCRGIYYLGESLWQHVIDVPESAAGPFLCMTFDDVSMISTLVI